MDDKSFDVMITYVIDGHLYECHAFGRYHQGDPRTWGRPVHDLSRDELEVTALHVADEAAWETASWDAQDLLPLMPQHRDGLLAETEETLRRKVRMGMRAGLLA